MRSTGLPNGAPAGASQPVMKKQSGEDALHHVSMYIRQTPADAVVVERELLVVQSQQVQRCCVQVVHGYRIFGRLTSKLIRSTVCEARLEPTAGQPTGEAI